MRNENDRKALLSLDESGITHRCGLRNSVTVCSGHVTSHQVHRPGVCVPRVGSIRSSRRLCCAPR